MKRHLPLGVLLESPDDGRNIDTSAARLDGEGALQRVQRLDDAFPTTRELPAASESAGTTYYGRPLLKQPVWIWSIPVYFYVGGLGGAAGVLAAAAQLRGRRLDDFVQRLRWISALSSAFGGALLIYDLGRPQRFLNMLRVFRPTSPMSVGSWLLAAKGASSASGAMLSHAQSPALRRWSGPAGYVAALIDLPFTAYTSVLLANTAVPVWQSARRTLPFLFAASSAAALTSFLELMPLAAPDRRIVRRFGVGARVADAIASSAVETDVSAVPEVARAIHEGPSGRLWRAGKVLNAAALALSLLPDRWRWARTAAGMLGTASALATRFAVVQAGHASAANPRAAFEQQRQTR